MVVSLGIKELISKLEKTNEVVDISIVIPMYNVEKYIDQFLKCLIEQTIQNFVAIVVDDKSTDLSLDLALKYKEVLQDRLVIIEKIAPTRIGINFLSIFPKPIIAIITINYLLFIIQFNNFYLNKIYKLFKYLKNILNI